MRENGKTEENKNGKLDGSYTSESTLLEISSTSCENSRLETSTGSNESENDKHKKIESLYDEIIELEEGEIIEGKITPKQTIVELDKEDLPEENSDHLNSISDMSFEEHEPAEGRLVVNEEKVSHKQQEETSNLETLNKNYVDPNLETHIKNYVDPVNHNEVLISCTEEQPKVLVTSQPEQNAPKQNGESSKSSVPVETKKTKPKLRKTEIGLLVVKLLTPAYVDKRFESREIFKSMARKISHSLADKG